MNNVQKKAKAQKIYDFTGTVYEVSEYLIGKRRLLPCERYFISADSYSICTYRATRIDRDSGLSKEEVKKEFKAPICPEPDTGFLKWSP
jgi:hypothetical protein